MKATRHALALVTLLAACASPPPAPEEPTPPLQEKLATQNRTALMAFESGRYAQAADLYDQALNTAMAMDDSGAIVDAHYNRAVSLMLAERYPHAKSSLLRAQEELGRSGRPSSPELSLMEATLAYRMGEDATAWRVSSELIYSADPVPASIAYRAWFLRGLLAHARSDEPELNRAIEALSHSTLSDTRSDRRELEGYRAAQEGDPDSAIAAFDEAASSRNDIGDYRGMSRSQVAAAEVLETGGRQLEAASRYLRAGRSAASRGSQEDARLWLERAETLAAKANAPEIVDEANRQLQQLDSLSE